MAHLAPVARWFGFGFGYTVAEAVALVAVGRYCGPFAVVMVMHLLNITFAVIAAFALIRLMFRMWRERKARPAGPLGTYAKSDSHRDGAAAGRAARGL